MKRIATAIAAALLAASAVSVVAAAPAEARDTSWDCPGCIAGNR